MALFCFDVVDELDLSGFYERYLSDGLGRAAHERSEDHEDFSEVPARAPARRVNELLFGDPFGRTG